MAANKSNLLQVLKVARERVAFHPKTLAEPKVFESVRILCDVLEAMLNNDNAVLFQPTQIADSRTGYSFSPLIQCKLSMEAHVDGVTYNRMMAGFRENSSITLAFSDPPKPDPVAVHDCEAHRLVHSLSLKLATGAMLGKTEAMAIYEYCQSHEPAVKS